MFPKSNVVNFSFNPIPFTYAITKKDFVNLCLTPSAKGKENGKKKKYNHRKTEQVLASACSRTQYL